MINENTNVLDVLIIGSGPSGLTAAIYAARGNVKTAIIEGHFGGQLMYTDKIDNYPGFFSNDPSFTTSGPNLIAAMRAQAEELQVAFYSDEIVEVMPPKDDKKLFITDENRLEVIDGYDQKLFIVKGANGKEYYAKTVIAATGSTAKWLGLPLEEKYKSNGIATCATCDGFFYRNQKVAIIGGGNTAAEDAIYLSKIAESVILIHRRDELRAEQILQKTLFAMPNVSYVWNSAAVEILEENDAFKGLKVENIKTGEKQDNFVDGLFVAIGHTPNTGFLKNLLPLTQDGYIDTNNHYDKFSKGVITSIPGLFVAGDMMDFVDRQAITAAAYGCMAARRALQFLYH